MSRLMRAAFDWAQIVLWRVWDWAGVLIAFVALLFLIWPAWPAFGDEEYQVRELVQLREYNFLSWVTGALVGNATADLAAGHIYLDEDEQQEVVLTFLDHLRRVQETERAIAAVYVDPAVDDKEAATAELRATLADRRKTLSEWQPMAEEILQDQVAAVLLDEGFGVGGHVWPPVNMHISPLPSVLIVSPRDEIRQLQVIPLESGIDTAARSQLESAIFNRVDRAAYVTNIGGLGLYPNMIMETTNLPFLAEVTAHEWSHLWFLQYPIGLNYAQGGVVRTANESAANIIGEEVGLEVLRRYYPQFLPPEPTSDPPPPTEPEEEAPATAVQPPPFDFRAEMAVTRNRVDDLLAEGKVLEAERYMEERRAFFVENGYNVRVLNQAYFAFHGAYADTVGAAGRDPVGPLVRRIWEATDEELRPFMEVMAPVTTYEDLLAVAVDLGVEIDEQ